MLNPKDTDANLLQRHRHQEAFSTSGVRRVHVFISLSASQFGCSQLGDKTLEEVASAPASQLNFSRASRFAGARRCVQVFQKKADDYLTLEIMHEICRIARSRGIVAHCIMHSSQGAVPGLDEHVWE